MQTKLSLLSSGALMNNSALGSLAANQKAVAIWAATLPGAGRAATARPGLGATGTPSTGRVGAPTPGSVRPPAPRGAGTKPREGANRSAVAKKRDGKA